MGLRVWGVGGRVQGVLSEVEDVGFRGSGLELRVEGLGFRIQGRAHNPKGWTLTTEGAGVQQTWFTSSQ